MPGLFDLGKVDLLSFKTPFWELNHFPDRKQQILGGPDELSF